MDVRYKYLVIIIFLNLLLFKESKSFCEIDICDAHSSGMGRITILKNDIWLGFGNQAGLAFIKNYMVGVSFENRYLLNELSMRSIASVLPVKFGVFGISYSTFGYKLYNENKTGLGYGKQLGKNIYAGIQLNYMTERINDEFYGKHKIITFEGGIIANVTDDLLFGFYVFNPNRTKISRYSDEKIQCKVKATLNYYFSKTILGGIEVEKEVDKRPMVKTGIEYSPSGKLIFRTGLCTNPMCFTFGFGLRLKQLYIDAAMQQHYILGYSPTLTLVYLIK